MQSNHDKSLVEPLSSVEWRLILLLTLINFTHLLDFVIIMPLGDQLREELNITPTQYSLIVSVYGICATVAGIIASSFTDRFDRRYTMVVCFAGFILATLYCGLAPTYNHLVSARGLSGVFGGVVASTVMAYIVDVIPPQRRGKAIGIVTSSFAIASTLGLPIGLYIANWAHHFGAPFKAIAFAATIVWMLSIWLLPSVPGHTKENRVQPLDMFKSVLRQRNHLWSFGFMLAMVFSTFMIVPFIGPYLEANVHMPRENLQVVYLVAGVCSLFTMNLIGWLTDRFGARPVFVTAASGAVVMTLVLTNLPPVSLLPIVIVTSLFMSVASSRVVPAQAMMLQTADPKARGAFTSLNTAMSHFAIGVGPIISGLIIGEEYPKGPLTHYPIAGLCAILFGIVAILLSFCLRPHHATTATT